MRVNLLILTATGGSLALLLGAWGFQHLGDLAPCKLCIWQRWPHAVAIAAGALALLWKSKLFPILGALGAATTAGIGLYHTGVERGWWEGPNSCTSGSIADVSPQDQLDQIMNAPLVQCDQVVWELAGMSMASWNGLISAGLFLIWLRTIHEF